MSSSSPLMRAAAPSHPRFCRSCAGAMPYSNGVRHANVSDPDGNAIAPAEAPAA
jgi:hypothetical protein